MSSFLAAALAALAGGLGLGGGSILLLYLTIFLEMPQPMAAGINLLFFLPTGGVALYLHHRHGLVNWRLALCLLIPGVVGAVVGSLLTYAINPTFIGRIFGGLVLIMGIHELFFGHKKNDRLNNNKSRRAN